MSSPGPDCSSYRALSAPRPRLRRTIYNQEVGNMNTKLFDIEMVGPEEDVETVICMAGYAMDYEIAGAPVDMTLMAYAVTHFDGDIGLPDEHDPSVGRRLAGTPLLTPLIHAATVRGGGLQSVCWQCPETSSQSRSGHACRRTFPRRHFASPSQRVWTRLSAFLSFGGVGPFLRRAGLRMETTMQPQTR